MTLIPEKTRADLEWTRIEGAILQRCHGPRGGGGPIPVPTTVEGAATARAETAEALALRTAGEALPLDGILPIRPALGRLERGGELDGRALADIASTLRAATRLRRFLDARKTRVPALHAACPLDPTLDETAESIEHAIDPDGTVADRASSELRSLRNEAGNLRQRIVSRLDELVVKRADVLSDRFYTLRDGRYVVPVRSDAHERVHGIVHGTSASGASVFVEPREIIPHGNRLKVALGQIEREEARILAALGAEVRTRLPEIAVAADALDHADLRDAVARFGSEVGGVLLEPTDGSRLDLRGARHPVLVLDRGADVVPNDISLAVGHALVLSGPNAGGKTVALKVLGLAALFARAGIPFPAREGSSAGFFEPVLTDVGDEQSLAKNLSTFSAHITNVVRILEAAGDGALVLLDEVATGTDPLEGGALACSIVEDLVEAGAAVAVTTHYESLKALATRHPKLENAAVGFDADAMRPTFVLARGVPGASSALDIAQRFGMPARIVTRARTVLPEEARTFEALVRELHAMKTTAAHERASANEERRQLERERARVAAEMQKLAAKDREALDSAARKLRAEVTEARDRVKAVRTKLKQETLEAAEIGEIKRELDRATEIVAAARTEVEGDAAEERARIDPSAIGVGDVVWVERLRTRATVLERVDGGRVRVAAGAMKLAVDVTELSAVATAPRSGARSAKPSDGKWGAVESHPTGRGDAAPSRETEPREPKRPKPALESRPSPRSRDNSLDVRGLRVDEAVSLVSSFLDRLYGAAEATGYILHGHGTGALRDAIRKHLEIEKDYVSKIRAASRDEGGEAVTVVELR